MAKTESKAKAPARRPAAARPADLKAAVLACAASIDALPAQPDSFEAKRIALRHSVRKLEGRT